MNSFIIQVTASLPAEGQINVWDMILKGGWLMIPIFLLSIIGVYIICERYYFISKTKNTEPLFLDKVLDKVHAGDFTGAMEECSQQNTPLSRMLIKGIKFRKLPAKELRRVMEGQASGDVAILEKGIPMLGTVAGMAPMIGFLGTVVGMVQAFYDMSMAGTNINITLLSRGIYTAMITTVAGLIVGIIAYFGYNLLVARIDRMTNEMEDACSAFIEAIHEKENL